METASKDGSTFLAVHPDGRLLAVASNGGGLALWDVTAGVEVLSWPIEVKDLAFTPDGAFLAIRGPGASVVESSPAVQMLDLGRVRAALARLGLDY